MIIKLTGQELEKTYHLLDTKEINISIADMIFATFEETGPFLGADEPEEFYQKLLEFWQINPSSKEDVSLLNKVVKSSIFTAKSQLFAQNPYFSNVKPQPVKDGEYQLEYLTFNGYQPFSLDDISVDENDYFLERSPIGCFLEDQSYLALTHKGNVWMSIIPNEINTMQPYIDKVSGKVLVLGLGLGYFPYMISLKDDVKEIVVIEKDKRIIDIFNKYLFKFFPYKEKIKIIYDDAFNYLGSFKESFDNVFIDLWHSPEDGLPLYIKSKKFENKFKGFQFHYWLEKSLIAMFRRCLLTVYEEALQGFKDKDYQKANNQIDRIINQIYFKTKNITITKYDDIYNLLTDESIKKLIVTL